MPKQSSERVRAAAADDEDVSDSEASGLLGFAARLRTLSLTDVFALTVAGGVSSVVLVNALFMQKGPHPAPIFAIAASPPSGDKPAQAQVAVAKPTVQPTAQAPVAAPAPQAPTSIAALIEATGAVVMPRPRPVDVALRPEPAKYETRSDPKPDIRPEAKSDIGAARTRGELIASIQRELTQRGFFDGPADGFYGPKTDAAIREFEQAARLRPSTEPNDLLLAAIQRSNVTAPRPPAAIPNATRPPRIDPVAAMIAPPADRVTAVQRALAQWGYGQIKPTGTIDADTQAAIEKFERERRMPVTGQVSDRLVRELASVTGRPLE